MDGFECFEVRIRIGEKNPDPSGSEFETLFYKKDGFNFKKMILHH